MAGGGGAGDSGGGTVSRAVGERFVCVADGLADGNTGTFAWGLRGEGLFGLRAENLCSGFATVGDANEAVADGELFGV